VARLRHARSDEKTERVRQFYTAAPFPGYRAKDTLGSLRARAERSDFARLLDRAISGDARIVEVGCGTGQMSLFLATADRTVVGADLTFASLELAASAARRFEISQAIFVETDLRAPALRAGAFDVVYCSGVLHHTPDPRASFAAIARLAKPGGIVVLGLYNLYARVPHKLRRAAAKLTAYRVIPFDPVLSDRAEEPERHVAWLRDQYQHPEEHCHTIAEVKSWFRDNDVEFLRTYPTTLIGAEPLHPDELFTPAEDDWWFENLLSQIAWSTTLGREGGLFIAVGRSAGAERASGATRQAVANDLFRTR
jgi:2-polyprenyl-3-methyl-5-hydroxy-6-metoxy-1,4-benzoquinol methylase